MMFFWGLEDIDVLSGMTKDFTLHYLSGVRGCGFAVLLTTGTEEIAGFSVVT
jgi:hypothetical protein